MRLVSSCWKPVENSQFHGRTPQPLSVFGSCRVVGSLSPNPLVSHAPHSPFARGSRRSQSGTLFSRRGSPTGNVISLTVLATFVERATAGWMLSAVLIPSCATPRVALAFTAVLPLPNKSYDTPIRGFTSFQCTTSAPGKVKLRLGTYLVGPAR